MANLTPEEINKQFERLKQLATTLNKDLSKLNLITETQKENWKDRLFYKKTVSL